MALGTKVRAMQLWERCFETEKSGDFMVSLTPGPSQQQSSNSSLSPAKDELRQSGFKSKGVLGGEFPVPNNFLEGTDHRSIAQYLFCMQIIPHFILSFAN